MSLFVSREGAPPPPACWVLWMCAAVARPCLHSPPFSSSPHNDQLITKKNRYGLLNESQDKLDYVLALTPQDFLERRLQTLVFKQGLAKSIHHARVLIRQRHVRVGKQVVNIPSFMVRVDSQKHIDFSLTSPFGGGRAGRVKRKNAGKGAGGDAEDDE